MSTTSIGTESLKADDALAGLLHLIARKDEAAMGELYVRTYYLVHGISMRVLRDPSAAEDTTQDVFIQIWKKADTFDSARGSALAWIITISRSRALDKLRTSKVFLCRETPGDGLGGLVCSKPGPEREILTSERAQLVRKSLLRVPVIQRRLIEMAFFEGLSQSEIACRASLPLGTVKSRIRAGVRWLRQQLSVLDVRQEGC